MKVKTADLIGPALDWAVAQCKGFKKIYAMAAWSNKHGAHGGPQVMVSNEEDSSFDYRPSSNWAQGGPIIERARIALRAHDHDVQEWSAEPSINTVQTRLSAFSTGPTPLISACRCFVAARLGDEVDIPDELV